MGHEKVILFIEGEANSPNGDLRQGFAKLLEGAVGQAKPAIKMGDGKSQVVRKFLKNKFPCSLALLLLDLDGPESSRNQDLTTQKLVDNQENVFYMIQEMEAWFLSQPEILDAFYGLDEKRKNVSDKLVKKKPEDISEPDKILEGLTKTTKPGKYHKIHHGVELLKLLDPKKLETQFPDFKRLTDRLRSHQPSS